MQNRYDNDGFKSFALPLTAVLECMLSARCENRQLFDRDNPADSFVITDDFASSGRISGRKAFPFLGSSRQFPHEWGPAVAGELVSKSGIRANWLTFSASLKKRLRFEPFYLEREFGL